MNRPSLLTLLLTLSLAGCGDEAAAPSGGAGEASDHGHEHGHEHGHDHSHDGGAGDTPHAGVMAELEDQAGHLELKLHDDKGDLELWLTSDAEGEQPMDLPLDTVVRVTFSDKGDRVVALRVRDKQDNADEEGVAQIRDGKTNYFIFPGDTGADATWLQGHSFKALAWLEFEKDGKKLRSELFRLVPHTH